MTEDQNQATWSVTEWHGKTLVDRDGENIGNLQDVYVDVGRSQWPAGHGHQGAGPICARPRDAWRGAVPGG